LSFDRNGIILACKKVGCWFVGGDLFDWSFARFIAPDVTTSSIILSSNKIQSGVILVLANSGPPGKMAVKIEKDFNTTNRAGIHYTDHNQHKLHH